MLILHASLENERLLLWGERPPNEGAATTPPRGSRKAPLSGALFPYDPDAEQLRSAIAAVLPGAGGLGMEAETRFAWLPTVKGRPVPSSALIAELPPPGSAA